MSKTFLEVFPTLKVEEGLKNLLEKVEVTKVSANHDKSHIRIYLLANRLIPKKIIWFLEKEIKDQLFAKKDILIKIIESFQLSEQFSAQTLLPEYQESIEAELNEYSVLLGNLYRTAEFTFETSSAAVLTIDDTIIAKTRGDELVRFLEKVICERCGLDFIIQVEHRKPKESKYRKNANEQIRQEVQAIIQRTRFGLAKEEDVPQDDVMMIADKASVKSQKIEKKAGEDAAKKGAEKKSFEKKTFEKKSFEKRPFEKRSFEKKGEFRKRYEPGSKKSDNPDVLYGRDFEDEPMDIQKIDGPIGEVVLRGKIISFDKREIRNEKSILMFSITDFTDTIMVKVFASNEDVPAISAGISPGAFVKIKGIVDIDPFDKELSIGRVVGIKKIPDFTTKRMDISPEKRVELHCHTKMSDMDGVSDASAIITRALEWGHKAIAITDHGDVQGFTEASHTKGIDKIKVIYGVEAYIVDDLKGIVTDGRGQSLQDSFVVFDIETTGFSPEINKIIEIGAVKVENGKITDRFSSFVNPEVPIPFRIEELTHINDSMVVNAPKIEEVLPQFLQFCEGSVLVAHNADFDVSFMVKKAELLGIAFQPTYVDTVAMARFLLPQLNRFKLDTVAKAVGVVLDNHHRAVDDAACTADIFVKFIEKLTEMGIETLEQLNKEGSASVSNIMKMPTYHAIILATCDQGRTNLYNLISLSHITYFNRRPRIPKSEFIKYRNGLLLGSACEAGELYRAILGGRPEEEISRIVEFYDYLEIQPLGNNAFMLRDEDSPIETEEDIMEINRRIVKLGQDFGKLVVATCDVHFLDPEDEVYRRIIMAGKGFKDADDQAPLYLRTTEEMLAEFAYLGSAKAEEVVITNTNKIADMCEWIKPVRPDKCPPVIENSDQMLRDICYNKAYKMYGNPLPEVVHARLERELNSIISNGYAVMYIIAQKLVWKSNEDGYLVGSRGSVGSSFVATMSGITEVNPLQAHYLCEECKYVDFDSEIVKSYAGRCGCDMPDAVCPNCGKPLKKEGFDIPFETFLGFKGDKEPDIDLNFSNEYQSKAHKYTEVIFGEGQTFKAGTVGTLADKTAFGYVKKYYEERGITKRKCEIERLAVGCTGIHRTTGQHPGGIIVLPVGENINTFTPVQHPANDMTVDITTTHFDYHSIDHNLLKLDILGHVDPTMIRMLQDLTGLDPTTIPLDDKAVMSLFANTEALGITPEDIGGTPLGALGIPEFGTDFAIGLVEEAKPTQFIDLVNIAGLSHGTDVWLGNAQTLIKEGTATISTCICTRDDIMTYLINKGLEADTAFKIMEAVRKGMVAKGKADKWPEWKQDMIDHGVPDWYIWSCEKIKYMFPKAHAAAYVMMGWRIAYCKVFYPLAYYAAYFSVRATGFNYELMCQGKEKLDYYLKEWKANKDSLSNKEQDMVRDGRIVQEMYARGFEFMPIDLYRAEPHRFQIIDGKLMPSFNSIEGLGDNAAIAIAEAAKDGPFLSKDDFRERTKVSKTVIELMSDMGLFGDLPDSNQLSLFDFK